MNVSIERSIGEWEEQAVLQASDRRSGDRFGSSVALDKVRRLRTKMVTSEGVWGNDDISILAV